MKSTENCLDRPIHSFDLVVSLGMFHLRQSMFNAVAVADSVERCHEGQCIFFTISKLNAIIS